ncbi:MAG: hypothetical protein IK038_06660 [Bacteroidaceae bacterium]|nr:hypothetical protein [Bacteroidaceae bacterium]
MKSLQSLIEGLGYNESHVICYRDEIWLEFDNFTLVLHYDSPEEGVFPDDDYFELKDIKASELHIDVVCLACGTNADEESYQENRISYTASMFSMCKQIQREFPDAIASYSVGVVYLDDCDLYGCPENCEFGYRIYLKSSFWEDKAQFLSFIQTQWNTKLKFRPYYKSFIGKKLKDTNEFAFLGTNTKVRRLGYLGLLVSLFENTPSIAKMNLGRLLEKKAVEFQNALMEYKNSKGVITPSKTGVSANPYIKTGLELGIIREMTGHYELGKMGRVYLEIHKIIRSSQDSPFELNSIEKTFWLERLLEQDFVYLFSLLEYAYKTHCPSYADLKKEFQGQILNKLESIKNSGKETSFLKKTTIRNAIERIKVWRKPEVYLEHVLMPRINWLYDLGLLELRNDLSFKLTREGNLLFLNLVEWGDLSLSNICNPFAYLEAFYMHIANELFMEGKGGQGADTNALLTETLAYCFEHFKTMAPNRVTYSVYQTFAKYTLLQNHLLVVEAVDIKERFLPSVADKYVFMYQNYYNDGFIQKK